MTLNAEKFSQGMTTQQYIEYIKVNKQPFLDIYAATDISAEIQGFFNNLPQPLNLLVLTSDWCGDAMSTTPAILRLADSSENLKLEVFSRDDEVDLTNSFLPEYRAGTTPVFVVFDSEMREVSRFVETARSLVPQIDAMDEMIANEVAGEGDNARAAGRGKRTAFRVSHAKEWSTVILNEFKQVVEEGLRLPPDQRPAEGGTQWPPQD